ncbi:hypothetical protein PC128_g9748 [Phytophthora cactorum]|nr:hypothetical protein PC120_g6789 [Phytophthora cactorum]KAG3193985.1 hypothetical protein PC128_g9748 [Phytophthora cactorum]
MQRPLSPPRRPRGLRMDLLETRIVAFDEFVQFEEQLGLTVRPLRPIPVLLRPTETIIEYERDFELWLAIRNVSLESLQSHPGVERLFRLDHSNGRFMELRRRHFGTETPLVVDCEERWESGTWKHNEEVISSNYGEERRLRSRSELLDWRLVSPDTFFSVMEDFGPNGRMYRGEKLRPIAVVLRPGETSSGYELNFQRWLSKKNLTLGMLHDDPEEERRLRQCFAYVRAYELMNRKRVVQRLRDQNGRREESMDRVQKRPRLEFDDGYAMETPITGQCDSVEQGANGLSKAEDGANSCASSTTISDPPYSPTSTGLEGTSNATNAEYSDISPDSMMKSESREARDRISQGADNSRGAPATSTKPANADIYGAATKLLLKAKQIEVDSVESELTKDYILVSRKLCRSEAAITDSLGQVRTKTLVDEMKATERSSQSDVLTGTLVHEQQRQNAVLASLIAYEWRDELEIPKQGTQLSINDEADSTQEKLAAIYDKLQLNYDDVLPLRIKLNNRLSWLKATDTDRDAQFQELWEISRALDGKLAQRSILHEQRRVLFFELVRSNEGIRTLVMGRLKKRSSSNS